MYSLVSHIAVDGASVMRYNTSTRNDTTPPARYDGRKSRSAEGSRPSARDARGAMVEVAIGIGYELTAHARRVRGEAEGGARGER